jgi:hypothetical protein
MKRSEINNAIDFAIDFLNNTHSNYLHGHILPRKSGKRKVKNTKKYGLRNWAGILPISVKAGLTKKD